MSMSILGYLLDLAGPDPVAVEQGLRVRRAGRAMGRWRYDAPPPPAAEEPVEPVEPPVGEAESSAIERLMQAAPIPLVPVAGPFTAPIGPAGAVVAADTSLLPDDDLNVRSGVRVEIDSSPLVVDCSGNGGLQ